MSDEKLWREEGPKALLEFLSSATGEDYDAAVYDTKLQFDSSNMGAVRYVASVAMTKASQSGEVFEEPMPCDGSVCPYDVAPEIGSMCSSYEERAEKESAAEFYFPDSSAYSDAVIRALERRNIRYRDMTEKTHEPRNVPTDVTCFGTIICRLLLRCCLLFLLFTSYLINRGGIA